MFVEHVLTCFELDMKTSLLRFWICEDTVEQYQSFYVSLFRSDGWFVVEHDEIRLGCAQPIAA